MSTSNELQDSKAIHMVHPFVQIEGVLNCRALPLSGRPTGVPSSADALAPRPWLFRSGDIAHITTRGITQLHACGIRKIFDLRSPGDVAKLHRPAPVLEGVEILKAPLFIETPAEIEKDGRYKESTTRKLYAEFREDELGAFMNSYTRILEDGCKGIGLVLRSIAERDDGEGILFHCSAGKDRAGVLSAVILSLAGTSDSAIIEDYALTTAGYEPHRDFMIGRFEREVTFQENREGAMNMFSSRPETMHAFLTLLREKYGGAENYARNVAGLTDVEIQKLKEKLQ